MTYDAGACRRAPTGRRGGSDEGFAMVTVIATMAVLTLLVITSLVFATQTIPTTKRTQDYHAALAAAQTGIDDLVARLNNCDGYWSTPCPGGPDHSDLVTNWSAVAAGDWVDVPTTDGQQRGQFAYGFVTTPAAVPGMTTSVVPGLIRLRADGRVGDVTRSITADLRKPGFLNYVYYTDREVNHPLTVARRYYPRTVQLTTAEQDATLDTRGTTTTSDDRKIVAIRFDGISTDAAAACDRHYYSVPPAPTSRRANGLDEFGGYQWRDASGLTGWYNGYDLGGASCNISFASGDVIDGPLYTKDAVFLGGSALFKRKAETYWLPAYRTAGETKVWRGTANPDPSGRKPELATSSVDMPPGNGDIRRQADPATYGTGCLYRGPTRIKLRADGRMDVLSPGTTTTNPGCGTGLTSWRTVNLPPNGVVYVDPLPSASCTGKVLGTYPLTGEWEAYNNAAAPREYECTAGDAYVEGTLKGQLTIATHGHIWVTGDVQYAGGTSGVDVLGLVAQGFVKVWHPVGCSFTPAAGYYCGTLTEDNGPFVNLLSDSAAVGRIDAAIMSLNASFTVQNYDKAPKVAPKLLVNGGIYQRNRGVVGTGGASSIGTGYLKDYRYDPRLVSLPPPHFLTPTSAPWAVVGFSEERRP